jgi:ABC-type uncharacterized transport system YnjBCD substrate-binding protein
MRRVLRGIVGALINVQSIEETIRHCRSATKRKQTALDVINIASFTSLFFLLSLAMILISARLPNWASKLHELVALTAVVMAGAITVVIQTAVERKTGPERFPQAQAVLAAGAITGMVLLFR